MEKIRKNLAIGFLACLAAVVALIWYAVFYVGSHRDLIMTVFDVGQGDSIFIELPNGNQVLIDGGPSDAVLAKLGHAMPFWDHSIDLVILTHPHADHVTGLVEVLKRYHVGMVMESDVNYATSEYSEWHRLLREKHIPVAIAHVGQVVHLSPRAELDILTPRDSFIGVSPNNVHDAMVISRLIYASTTALLVGDEEKPLEYRLIASGEDLISDILKVGHHGSKTSTTEVLIQAVRPKFAVISAGRKNRYGHPHQQTLDTLHKFGIQIFRTDTDGDISFVSNGKRIWHVE